MKITWVVEDGYGEKTRPQHSEINDDEIADCETEGEALKLIREYVQDDFENSITWWIRGYERMTEEVQQILAKKS